MSEEKTDQYCSACAYAETCVALAQLKTLAINRSALEGEYGWDVFSFIAEAKREFRRAQTSKCSALDRVRIEAARLAPEVDFSRVS
jgi:hypothetical protein